MAILDPTNMVWHKSTRSGNQANCVEIGTWRKSSRSTSNGQCVEVARNLPSLVAVRDSKNPTVPALIVEPAHWTAFAGIVKRGIFTC